MPIICSAWCVRFAPRGRRPGGAPYKLTLVAYHLDGVDLPEFAIHPEGRAEKVTDKLFAFYRETVGHRSRDLDFPGTFSDRYVLGGEDEGAVRALFGPGMVGFRESLPVEERWAAAGTGHSLVVYRAAPWSAGREQTIRPEAIEMFLNGAATIAARRACIPSYHRDAPLAGC